MARYYAQKHRNAANVAAEIEKYQRRYVTPGMTVGGFAPLLPEHLRQAYYDMKIEEALDADEEEDQL